ncbi:MAG: HEAT repeat domain-containing protein [Deltaproteobacteria bacterium]|nr:HEAT repeat domain-containing protein [Deltaproteobacteria bacterium]
MKLLKILLPGLFAAQVIATIQVYLSNAGLYRALMAIGDAGYLAVPNRRVMVHLGEFGPAFFGGLFFTLTVGAGLSILAFAAAWMWDRGFSRNRLSLGFFLILWVGCLVLVSFKGFCAATASYFLFVPPMVFAAALKWMPKQIVEKTRWGELFHIIPLLLLAVMWVPMVGSNVFLNIRDSFLLSDSPGKWINDFYYNYTLYPAEAFKSLDQKMIRTCNHDEIGGGPATNLVKEKLLRHDYLPIRGYSKADLEISSNDGLLVFKNRGKAVLRIPPKDFLSRSGPILRDFSLKTDRYSFFRKFVFFCLLTGSPVILYIILRALFLLALTPFMNPGRVSVMASVLCLLTGGALLILLYSGSGRVVDARNLSEAMESGNWKDRVAALKFIGRKGMEVSNFEAYERMLKSPRVPERYWLAKAMSKSRKPETGSALLALLDDPHRNVVCMAFYALGWRGNSAAEGEIIRRIEASGDWYTQWYAYRALRALGWKQAKSK